MRTLPRFIRYAALLMVLTATPVLTFGLSATTAQAQSDYELTSDIVENFLASYPALLAKSDELEGQYGGEGSSSPMEAFSAYMAQQGAVNELTAIVTEHGFSGFADWMQAASAIMMAHAFSKEGSQMDSRFNDAIEGIRNNPNMSDDQKDAMIAQVEASMGAMGALRPSPANIEAVAPYADEIESLTD